MNTGFYGDGGNRTREPFPPCPPDENPPDAGASRRCRHKGDRGECLAPDCNCPPRTVPAPSDEERWAVKIGEAWEANIRAEERAATLREVEVLEQALTDIAGYEGWQQPDVPVARAMGNIARDALANFNQEADR